ncbi:MAG: hypothetical protein AAB909_01290 [Patescibacteria group bacterium]
MQIIPAILTNETQELDSLLRQIHDSKKFERVQIDFIDGEFANNKTIKPSECDLIPYLPLKFDAHLMVSENNIVEWSKLAASMGFERVIAQMESISEPGEYVAIAIDDDTPVEAVEKYLPNLDYLIIMTVDPGYGGQEFEKRVLDKIRQICHIRQIRQYKFKVCVDGGVEKEHLKTLEELGVDEVAVGAKRCLEW